MKIKQNQLYIESDGLFYYSVTSHSRILGSYVTGNSSKSKHSLKALGTVNADRMTLVISWLPGLCLTCFEISPNEVLVHRTSFNCQRKSVFFVIAPIAPNSTTYPAFFFRVPMVAKCYSALFFQVPMVAKCMQNHVNPGDTLYRPLGTFCHVPYILKMLGPLKIWPDAQYCEKSLTIVFTQSTTLGGRIQGG